MLIHTNPNHGSSSTDLRKFRNRSEVKPEKLYVFKAIRHDGWWYRIRLLDGFCLCLDGQYREPNFPIRI